MKIKNNVNYFARKGTMKIVGAAMVALGFLLYFVGWGWIAYILMCVCIPAGAALFIIGSSGRASDEDIDEFIAVKMRDLDPGLDTDRRFSGRVVKGSEPIALEGYEYREGLMFAKTKSGSVRSSELVASVVYILTDAVYLIQRRISLISDEVEDSVRDIPFGDILSAELVEEAGSFTFNKNLFRVKAMHLRIQMKDGGEILIPVHDDMRSENAVSAINRVVG